MWGWWVAQHESAAVFNHTLSADLVPLRLEGGSHPGEGRVEVFFQGVWGTICNEDFDDEDAQVVCRSLGLR